MPRKVVIKLRMCVSLGTHSNESCFKVAECVYFCVLMPRKVVLKLLMCISLRTHGKESCIKVADLFIAAYLYQGMLF